LQIEKTAAANALKSFEELVELIQTAGGFLQQFFAVLNRAAVMRRQQKEANRFRLMAIQQIAERAGTGGFAYFGGLLRCDVAGLRAGGSTGRASGTHIRRASGAAANFAHLGGRLHQSVVEPIFCLRFAVSAFALGDFIFVVRKN
jgi:hypothetical protein